MIKKLSRKQLITAVSASSAIVVGVGVGIPVGLLVNNRAAAPAPLVRDLTKSHAPLGVPYGTGLDNLLIYAPNDFTNVSAYESPVLEPALTTYTATTMVEADDDAKVAYKYAPKDPATTAVVTYVYKVDVTPLAAQKADIAIDSDVYLQGYQYVPSLTASENEAIARLLPAGHAIDNLAAPVVYGEDGKQTTITVIMTKQVGYKFSVVYKTAILPNYTGEPGKVTVNYSVQPSATSGAGQQVAAREITYGEGLDQDPEGPQPISGYALQSVSYKLTKSAAPAAPVGTIERAAVKNLTAGSEFQIVYSYTSTSANGFAYSQYYLYTVTKAAIADSEVPRLSGTTNLPYGSAYTPPVLAKAPKYSDWTPLTYRITKPVTSGTVADPRFNTVKDITPADMDDLPSGTVVTVSATATPDANHSGANGTAVYTVNIVARPLAAVTQNRDALWDIGGSLALLSAPNTAANYRAFDEPVYTGSDGVSFASMNDERIEAKFNADPDYTVTQTYVAQPNGPNYGGAPFIFNTTYHLFKITAPAVSEYQFGTNLNPTAPTALSKYFNPWTRMSPGKVKITKPSGTGPFANVGEYSDADVKSFNPGTEFAVGYTASAKSGYLASGPITTLLVFKVSAKPVSHADITTNFDYTYGSRFAPPSAGPALEGYGDWTGGVAAEIPAQAGQSARTAAFSELPSLPVGTTFNVVFTAAPAAGSTGKSVKSTFIYRVVPIAVPAYKNSVSVTMSYGDEFSKIALPPAPPTGYAVFVLEKANSVYIYKPTDDLYESERAFATAGYYPATDVSRFPTSKNSPTEFRVTYVADLLANYSGTKATYEINVKIVPREISKVDVPGNGLGLPEQQWTKTVYGASLPTAALPKAPGQQSGFEQWTGPYYKVTKALPTTANNYSAEFGADKEFDASRVNYVPAGTAYAVYFKAALSKNFTFASGTDNEITFGKNFLVTRASLQGGVEKPYGEQWADFALQKGFVNWDKAPNLIMKHGIPAGFALTNKEPKLKVTRAASPDVGVGMPVNVGEFVVGKEFSRSDWSKLPLDTLFSEIYELEPVNDNYEPATFSFYFIRWVSYSDANRWVYYVAGDRISEDLVPTPPVMEGTVWSQPVYAKQPFRYDEQGENVPPVVMSKEEFFRTAFKLSDYPTVTYTGTLPSGQIVTDTTTFAYRENANVTEGLDVSFAFSRPFGFEKSRLDPEVNEFFLDNANHSQKALFNTKFGGAWKFSGDKVIFAPGPQANNYESGVYALMQSGASGLSGWSKSLANVPAGTVYELYYTAPSQKGFPSGEAKLTLRITVTPYDGKNSGLRSVTFNTVIKQGAPFTIPTVPASLDQFATFGGGSWQTIGFRVAYAPSGFKAEDVMRLKINDSFDYVYSFKFPDNDNVVAGSLPNIELLYHYLVNSDGIVSYNDIPANFNYLRGSTFTPPAAPDGFGPYAGYGPIRARLVLLNDDGTSVPLDPAKIILLKKNQRFAYVWYYESLAGGRELSNTKIYTVVNPQVTKTVEDENFASSVNPWYGLKGEFKDNTKLPDLTPYGYDNWVERERVITKTIPSTDLRYESWMAVGNRVAFADLYKLPAGVSYTTYYEAAPNSFHEGRTVIYGITYTVIPIPAPKRAIITALIKRAYVPNGPILNLDDALLENPATAANDNVDEISGKCIYGNYVWSNDVVITNLPQGYAGIFKIGQRILWSELKNLPLGAYFSYNRSAPLVNANFKGGVRVTNYYMRVGSNINDLPVDWDRPEQYDPTDLGEANAITKSLKEQLSSITSTWWDERTFSAIFVNGYTVLTSALANRLGISFNPTEGAAVVVSKQPGDKTVTYDIHYGASYAQAKVTFNSFGTARNESWVEQVVSDLINAKTSYLADAAAFKAAEAGVKKAAAPVVNADGTARLADAPLAEETIEPEDAVDAAPKLGLALDRGFYRGLAKITKLAGSNVFTVTYVSKGTAKTVRVTLETGTSITTPLGETVPAVSPQNVLAPDVQRELNAAIEQLKQGASTWKPSLGFMKYGNSPFDNPLFKGANTLVDRIDNLTETTGVSVGNPKLLNSFPTLDIAFTMLNDDSSARTVLVPNLLGTELIEAPATANQLFYIIKPKGLEYYYVLPVQVSEFNADPYANQARMLASLTATSLSQQAFMNLSEPSSVLSIASLKLGLAIPEGVDPSVFRVTKQAGSTTVTFEYFLPNNVDVSKKVTATITSFGA